MSIEATAGEARRGDAIVVSCHGTGVTRGGGKLIGCVAQLLHGAIAAVRCGCKHAAVLHE